MVVDWTDRLFKHSKTLITFKVHRELVTPSSKNGFWFGNVSWHRTSKFIIAWFNNSFCLISLQLFLPHELLKIWLNPPFLWNTTTIQEKRRGISFLFILYFEFVQSIKKSIYQSLHSVVATAARKCWNNFPTKCKKSLRVWNLRWSQSRNVRERNETTNQNLKEAKQRRNEMLNWEL